MHLAALGGYKDVAEVLLANGAEVNAKDNKGYTHLHKAAINGHKDVAELLLAEMSRSMPRIANGLRLSCSGDCGPQERGRFLPARNAEVNAKSNKGETPLHWAAFSGHKDVAEVLLARNAEINAKDHKGWTPLKGRRKWATGMWRNCYASMVAENNRCCCSGFNAAVLIRLFKIYAAMISQT